MKVVYAIVIFFIGLILGSFTAKLFVEAPLPNLLSVIDRSFSLLEEYKNFSREDFEYRLICNRAQTVVDLLNQADHLMNNKFFISDEEAYVYGLIEGYQEHLKKIHSNQNIDNIVNECSKSGY